MPTPADTVRLLLGRGPATSAELASALNLSQQSVSRRLLALDDEVLRIGAARSTRYLLRDQQRGVAEVPVFRVDEAGRVARLARLLPVRPQGWLMSTEEGERSHYEGLPWWLNDMRLAGFLGRAWAMRHADQFGLSPRLSEWQEAEHLRAMLVLGHDAMGHLLLGERAHERFLTAPPLEPVALAERGPAYAELAARAALGEWPGTSAGGEQPKFTTYAQTASGPAHVLVKFTLLQANPLTQRWADLLLAEHHALQTLASAGLAAAQTEVLDFNGQRFLEVQRFDRAGASGRRALISLASLDAEFVGAAPAPWPVIVQRLVACGAVQPQATAGAALLYAFGTLIGNTDMHPGNLSFTGAGRPYALAPAYDMLPMGFAPTASGALPASLPTPLLRPVVPSAIWQQAMGLANLFMARLAQESRWSQTWPACMAALEQHLAQAQTQLDKLG